MLKSVFHYISCRRPRLHNGTSEKEKTDRSAKNVKEKRIVFSCDANGIIIHKARPTLLPFNDLDYIITISAATKEYEMME